MRAFVPKKRELVPNEVLVTCPTCREFLIKEIELRARVEPIPETISLNRCPKCGGLV